MKNTNYKSITLLLVFILLCGVGTLQSFNLQNGDILFQDGSQNSFNDAVKDVTTGTAQYNFSHCGIYFTDTNGTQLVIEATFDGVVNTPLGIFLKRHVNKNGQPQVVVGRLHDSLKQLVPNAIRQASKYLGKNYDFEFNLENEEIYCSELAYFAFRDANAQPIFELQPMSFKNPKTGTTLPFWQEYFDKLNKKIPEGKLGTNPNSLYKTPIITIVHRYY